MSCFKKIQDLPLRTHNYVVRGMVNQMSVMSMIECKKLAFLQKLIGMNVMCLHKQLFIRRCYENIFGDHMLMGFVPNICSILKKYQLIDHFYIYIYVVVHSLLRLNGRILSQNAGQ